MADDPQPVFRPEVPQEADGDAVSAIRHDTSTVGGGALAGIAAAIETIKSELATAEVPRPDGLAVLERMRDIAYLLHERAVEQTLCDQLDSAIREASDVYAYCDAVAERCRRAAELLRGLADRVGGLTASTAAASLLTEVADTAQSLGREPAPQPEIPVSVPVTADLRRDGAATEAVQTSEPAAPASSRPSPVELLPALDLFADAPIGATATAIQDAEHPAADLPGELQQAGPADDPGDLFEIAARTVECAADAQTSSQKILVEAAGPSRLGIAESPQARPNSAMPAAPEAIAAIRALSAEELIALFS